MKVKYLGESFTHGRFLGLTDGKIYECLSVEDDYLRVIDDEGVESLYAAVNPGPSDGSMRHGRWEVIEDNAENSLRKAVYQEDKRIIRSFKSTRGKCPKCGALRVQYWSSGFLFGEILVSTRSGEHCAYAYLLEEKIIPELTEYCTELFAEKDVRIDEYEFSSVISSIYGITCDDLEGQRVDSIRNALCPHCADVELQKDKEYGEKEQLLVLPLVSHCAWDKLSEAEKKQKVYQELLRQRIIKG